MSMECFERADALHAHEKALRAIKEQLRKYCEEGAYEDTDRQ